MLTPFHSGMVKIPRWSHLAVAAAFICGCAGCAPDPETQQQDPAPTPAAYSGLPDGYAEFRDSLIRDPRVPAIVRHYMSDGRTVVSLHRLFEEEQHLVTMPFADLNDDGVSDPVLVMPEGYPGEGDEWIDGQSFVFTDPRFGKLRSPEPGCNHVTNLFLLDDIDEDGLREVGLYTSSCASRYKALRVFTLRPDTTWQHVAAVTFDTFCEGPPKEARVRKLGKGAFELLRVECEGDEGQAATQVWEPHGMVWR